MIQWIALAVALDSNSKAGKAVDGAEEAKHNSKGNSPLVIIRPVMLVDEPTGETWKLFGIIIVRITRRVLADKPWGTFSIRKSDILNISESADQAGQRFCTLKISKYAGITKYIFGDGECVVEELFIPGTIEEVAAVID